MNRVEISIEVQSGEAPVEKRVAAFVKRALELMNVAGWEVSLLFCDDQRIRILNRDFRDRDEVTDVLSFSQLEGETPPFGAPDGDVAEEVYAGDIVIAVPRALDNAREFAVDREEELKRLIVHGLLHLAGFDHGNESSDQPMLQEQERIVARLTRERLF